jgi:cytoskeleton protein RodZ
MAEVKQQAELSDDIEVMGPGQILAEARIKLGMSVETVAQRLNFTLTLVKHLEQNCFDEKLPETFTRGYLKNYAKLVHVSENDIIASYEMLDVAKLQCAEMQSFSRITKKNAENNRLMWISYFVLAVLIALTVLWWMQESKNTEAVLTTSSTQTSSATDENIDKPAATETHIEKQTTNNSQVTPAVNENTETNALTETNTAQGLTQSSDDNALSTVTATAEINTIQTPKNEYSAKANNALPAQAVFTFSGDCWVNIYDNTGERVAWGIKKSGYVMTIEGVAPFKVTLGKPELVTIEFNGSVVDLSKFSAGNIAKFTLPLNS